MSVIQLEPLFGKAQKWQHEPCGGISWTDDGTPKFSCGQVLGTEEYYESEHYRYWLEHSQ